MDKQAAVVITSIAAPTRAVEAYAISNQVKTIVIGDTKTPNDWFQDNVIYLSIEDQRAQYQTFGSRLPVDHYCRKNIGYLEAIRRGYQIIVDTDDDNIPLDNWYVPEQRGEHLCTSQDKGFINVYSYFTGMQIWPRGLPLDCVMSKGALNFKDDLRKYNYHVPVWQGLANGDPDVDAIYRLVLNGPCTFDSKAPIVLDKGTISPYNSQNTITYKEAFPLLYLPSCVSFRLTDILRGLVGQVILWDHGYRLGFFEATVVQERNIHDLMEDFKDELPMYLNVRKVIEIASDAIIAGQSMAQQLTDIYQALVTGGVVGSGEIELLDLWLQELAMLDN